MFNLNNTKIIFATLEIFVASLWLRKRFNAKNVPMKINRLENFLNDGIRTMCTESSSSTARPWSSSFSSPQIYRCTHLQHKVMGYRDAFLPIHTIRCTEVHNHQSKPCACLNHCCAQVMFVSLRFTWSTELEGHHVFLYSTPLEKISHCACERHVWTFTDQGSLPVSFLPHSTRVCRAPGTTSQTDSTVCRWLRRPHWWWQWRWWERVWERTGDEKRHRWDWAGSQWRWNHTSRSMTAEAVA